MPSIIALIGPTAVGKTDVSIELARRLNAEIVGCDSMQVYRHMPILTQQPIPAQREAVAHHLIDCVEPAESYSVGRYRRDALEAVAAIQRRGRAALLVGGTGLYLKALTNGLCEAPPADPLVREELAMAAQRLGSPALHERLKGVDPVAAAKIHPHDARRLVRALEVYTLTGEPLSRVWRQAAGQALPVRVFGLTRDRDELYARINHRVERMIHEEGALEEARRVLAMPLGQTARQVHGLKFLSAYLRGERSLEETITLWQQQVRQYARRQLIWFRAVPQICWITVSQDETTGRLVERILQNFRLKTQDTRLKSHANILAS